MSTEMNHPCVILPEEQAPEDMRIVNARIVQTAESRHLGKVIRKAR